MNRSQAHEALLADRLFGELSPEEQAALEAELAASADVRATLHELRATLRLMAARRRPEPPPTFWDGYADRVMQRVEREARTDVPLDRPGQPAPHLMRGPSRRRWVARTSVAAVLVLVGIGIGSVLFDGRQGESPQDGRQAEAVSPDGRPAGPTASGGRPAESAPAEEEAAAPTSALQPSSLDVRAERYLGRSKVLLLGLVNVEEEGDGRPAVLGFERKQEVAGELVRESAALQAELDRAGERRLRALVADLEVVLLQIANLEAEHDLPAVELVRQGVDRRALLLQINLAEMRGPLRPTSVSDGSTL